MTENNSRKEKTLSDYERLKTLIEDPAMVSSFAVALNGSPVMPWIKGALTCIWRDKKLRRATEQSVIGVLMQAATMGLRFEDALGQAYLSSREVWKYDEGKNKTVFSHIDAQLQIGYRGFIDIAHRDPNVRQVEAVVIREGDKVDFFKGSKPFIDHTWDIRKGARERGRIVAIYSGLRYKDEFYAFEIYPFDEIVEHRNITLGEKGIIVKKDKNGEDLFFKKATKWARYSDVELFEDNNGSPKYYLQQINGDGRIFPLSEEEKANIPWIAYLIAMGKKTTIRWSAKYWPMSPEFHSAAYFAETEEHGLEQKIEDAVIELIPEEIRKKFIGKRIEENDSPVDKRKLSPSQRISLSNMSDLAAQMAREAGVASDDDTNKVKDGKTADSDVADSMEDVKNEAARDKNDGKDTIAELEAIKVRDEEKKKKIKKSE